MAVAVAVGSGVILGKDVIVLAGVREGFARGAVKEGVAIKSLPFCVWEATGVEVTGMETGAGSVTRQADATRITDIAINNGLYFLFIV